MTVEAKKETLGFQAEVKQLLHLMIHSLYSNKEIFLRELISNASDAADKLRFEALSEDGLYENDAELKISIDFDKEAKTLTISDNGIGMGRDEVIENLGTIAKSGTAQFLQKLTGDQKKDSQLIGQFGVGFYSSFIVADQVEVLTRRAGTEVSQGVHWVSQGEGEFTIESIEKPGRGTTIILHLKDAEAEFADGFRLRELIRKYSDHISIPVVMKKETPVESDDSEEGSEEKEQAVIVEDETVNTATALWTRGRSDVSEEEYKEFYKHVSHDYADPMTWSHNKVEGKLEYTSLLYIPSKAPYDLWNRDGARGLKLYVQRVFIMDDAEQFLPLYLRFVKGVIDSNDLSLNVSRDLLQNDKAVETMNSALTKCVLDMLSKMAKNDAEKYQAFWQEFGQVLKEGPAEDFSNKEKVAKLLRFATTHNSNDEQNQSLEDYVGRMQEKQEKIYYITADNYNTAKNSPHLEIFKKKGIEVLLLIDRVDEWLMSHLFEFDGKQFQDVTKGELDLGDAKSDDAEDKADEAKDEEAKPFLEKVKGVLEEKVSDVRVTHRLVDSPACLVLNQFDMGAQMRKIMEAAGQAVPDSKPVFEVNLEHPLIKRLQVEASQERFADLSWVLYDQANLSAGNSLADSSAFVSRLNKLLLELTQ